MTPFHKIVECLPDEDFVPITLLLLEQFKEFYVQEGVNFTLNSQIFESLRFLEEHNVVEIQYSEESHTFLIKSKYGTSIQQS